MKPCRGMCRRWWLWKFQRTYNVTHLAAEAYTSHMYCDLEGSKEGGGTKETLWNVGFQ
jgi:hypothetical protein